MKYIELEMSTKFKRNLVKLFASLLALIGAPWGIFEYLDHETSMAVVRSGSLPVVAAVDLPSFKALLENSEEAALLKASGKVFVISEPAHCKVIKRDWFASCDGSSSQPSHADQPPPRNPVETILLNGAHRGQRVWICSDNIQMLHPWL